MDKVCATCGKQLQADQGFCDNCGAAWTPGAEAASSTAASPISAAPQPAVSHVAVPAQTAGSGNSSKALLIVAIVVIALGIGGWLFVRQRTHTGSSVVTTTTSSSTTVTKATAVPLASNGAQATAVPSGDTAGVVPPGAPPPTAAEPEASANAKPCSLVTRAEMEAILGLKIVKLTADESNCQYYTDETSSVVIETTWTGGKAMFLQMKGFHSAPDPPDPVTGIGDDGYFPVTQVLHVLKGDTYVAVNARVYPNPLETESAIARKAMERLK